MPIGDVVAGEDLSYNRLTSPQSSLSQPVEDSLSTDGGIVRSWCNSGSCCCHLLPGPIGVMFECTDPVQVVCHCEDDQLSCLRHAARRHEDCRCGQGNKLQWPCCETPKTELQGNRSDS